MVYQDIVSGKGAARELERRKSAQQKAEDIAYTINHSLYCTLTDFINPPINAATDNWLRWLIPGCGHDHSGQVEGHGYEVTPHVHGPGCGHVHEAVAVHMCEQGHVPGHVHGPQCSHGKTLTAPVVVPVPPSPPSPARGEGGKEMVSVAKPDVQEAVVPPSPVKPAEGRKKTVIVRKRARKPAAAIQPEPVAAPVEVHVHGAGCGHDKPLIPIAEEEGVQIGVKKKGFMPVCTKGMKGVVCAEGHFHAPEGMGRWERVKAATRHAFSRERFIQYAKGEFVGDFGAVPITIGMQRLFPGVMDGLRTLAEPVVGGMFRAGVARDSKRWAAKQGVEVGSEDYKKHVAEVYEHEMKHFPQAIVWTGASLGLNVGYQMHADKTEMPFMKKAALKTTSVLSGVLVTAGMVVAARAFAPHRVRDFDRWTSGNFILPGTKVVGKIFGVDEQAVDRMMEKQERLDGWAGRVSPGQQVQYKGALSC